MLLANILSRSLNFPSVMSNSPSNLSSNSPSNSPPSSPTRQRLIQAALDLFQVQGLSGTTTRQIAEVAGVNEVTLFRQFGNKSGLLLAVLEEAGVFQALSMALVPPGPPAISLELGLRQYARQCLNLLTQAPELTRSLIGEAREYPEETQRSIGQGLTLLNQTAAHYLATLFEATDIPPSLPPDQLASILNCALLGYAAVELTSEFHQLWGDLEDFVTRLVQVLLARPVDGAPAEVSSPTVPVLSSGGLVPMHQPIGVADLMSPVVHLVLQRSKKLGLRDYALSYVLFGAGLSPAEVIGLERSHPIYDATQHLIQVVTPSGVRLMPVNQWILGKRYGSYTNNPLTKWLRVRKDDQTALFLNAEQLPLTEADLQRCWETWTEGLRTAQGQPLMAIQAQHTWFVEMLMRGMSVENLSILTGRDRAQLQPYAQRAAEKTALDQALRLDQK